MNPDNADHTSDDDFQDDAIDGAVIYHGDEWPVRDFDDVWVYDGARENGNLVIDADFQDCETSYGECIVVYEGPSDDPPAPTLDDCYVYDGDRERREEREAAAKKSPTL